MEGWPANGEMEQGKMGRLVAVEVEQPVATVPTRGFPRSACEISVQMSLLIGCGRI